MPAPPVNNDAPPRVPAHPAPVPSLSGEDLMAKAATADPEAFTLLTTHSATLEDVFVSLTGRHLRDA